MPETLSTLFELCLKRTAGLLRTSFWNPELPLSHNLFALLPSFIIDTLIIYVTRISTSTLEPLLSSDLRLLLTSGRVRHFTLQDENGRKVKVNCKNLERMLMDLSSFGCYLTTVKIDISPSDKEGLHGITTVLNSLLNAAESVEYVESSIEFDLSVLRNSSRLEKLVLKFSLKNQQYDFLKGKKSICGLIGESIAVLHGAIALALGKKRNFSKFWGQRVPFTSLKHVQLPCETEISHLDVAFILQYCTELVSINCDISKSLEHLHAEELHCGSITRKYKIQKCYLGIDDRNAWGTSVSRDAVLIASLTCPFLQDLSISVKDYAPFSAFSDFKNLTKLSIRAGEFVRRIPFSGVRSLLEKQEIGHNLRSLKLEDFTHVDFSSISMCCPNLEQLEIVICHIGEYSPTSFAKLESLLFFCFEHDIQKDALIGILSSAPNLKRLCVYPAVELTDDVLEVILRKNSLLHLKHFEVMECGLSLRGWRNLASSLRALESIEAEHYNGSFAEISGVFREISPLVVMSNRVSHAMY